MAERPIRASKIALTADDKVILTECARDAARRPRTDQIQTMLLKASQSFSSVCVFGTVAGSILFWASATYMLEVPGMRSDVTA